MTTKTLKIQFKAKQRTVHNMDNSIHYVKIDVPKITRNHCDMHAFRVSRRFGGYANSDLFLGMIRGELKRLGIGEIVKLDNVPDSMTVDGTGFLSVVTILVPDSI